MDEKYVQVSPESYAEYVWAINRKGKQQETPGRCITNHPHFDRVWSLVPPDPSPNALPDEVSVEYINPSTKQVLRRIHITRTPDQPQP